MAERFIQEDREPGERHSFALANRPLPVEIAEGERTAVGGFYFHAPGCIQVEGSCWQVLEFPSDGNL